MSHRFKTRSAAAALALAGLTSTALAGLMSTAIAADDAAIHGAKTVGAMRFESYGVATKTADVQRQGGFVMKAAVHWTTAPAETEAASGAAYNAGSVGALSLETRGLATSFADVRRQGGATTAGMVRWTSAPAR